MLREKHQRTCSAAYTSLKIADLRVASGASPHDRIATTGRPTGAVFKLLFSITLFSLLSVYRCTSDRLKTLIFCYCGRVSAFNGYRGTVTELK